MDSLDSIFEALANEHRREIVYTLGFQPASISQLAQRRKLSLPAIYKHIKILESAGLIERRKSGRTNFIALNKAALLELQQWLMQYHAHWASPQESLKNYISDVKQSNS